MEHTEYSTSNNSTLNNEVYFQAKVSIPFSWEHKPGLSKVTHKKNDSRGSNSVLQPPPRSSSTNGRNKQLLVEDTKTEGPNFILCAVQPSSSLRIRSFRLESDLKGDPFVQAYKNCTETPKDQFMHKRSSKSNKSNASWLNITKYIDIFSCKFSDDVMSIV